MATRCWQAYASACRPCCSATLPWRWVRGAGLLGLAVAAWFWTPLRMFGYGPAALAATLGLLAPWVDRRRLAVLVLALAGAAWPWQQMHDLMGEHDAYYYFFLHSEMRAMLTAKQLGPDVVVALRTVRPPIVVYDGEVRALPREVQDYIRANYVATGVGALWRRNDWTPLEDRSESMKR